MITFPGSVTFLTVATNSKRRSTSAHSTICKNLSQIMSKPILRLLLLSVFTFLPASMAQVGFSKCACTPGSYEFTLDFTATCKNSNIPNGDNAGIESTTCFTSPGSDRSITNFVFDKVLEILITEFSRGFSFLNNLQLRGPFLDGYTFTYTSITSDPNLTLESLPGILGIRIIGVNDEGQQFDTTWSVTFTNDCNSFPVFGDGGTVPQIGPTKLVSSLEPTLMPGRAS